MAPHIIKLMARHQHYTEPFAGGLAVLLTRDPNDQSLWLPPHEGVSEIINDLNEDLSNFWQVLRSRELFPEFQRQAQLTPLSKIEWELAGQILDSGSVQRGDGDKAALAFAYYVRIRQSRSGMSKDFTSLTRNRLRRGVNGNVSEWLGSVDGLEWAHHRLVRVAVDNRPAVEFIKREDVPGALHYCLTPGNLVRMEDERLVYVEDVRQGDRVFGGKTVLSTMSRSYRGEVCVIRIQGLPSPVITTVDHPWVRVPACTGRQEKRGPSEMTSQIGLVEAGSLQVGDLIPVPTGGMQKTPYWVLNNRSVGNGRRKQASLSLGKPLFRLLGYYAAEGHIGRSPNGIPRGTILDFGREKKKRQIADALECGAKSFGLEWSEHPGVPHATVTQVRCFSTSVAEFFAEQVPGTAVNKQLSDSIMTAPTEWQLELLSAWCRTDGHEGVASRGRVKLCGTTSSSVMAKQMFAIALRCGLRPSFKVRVNEKSTAPAHDVYFAAEDSEHLGMSVPPGKFRSTRRIVNGNVMSRVRSVDRMFYSGQVYNLDVDGDSLFAAPFALTHNCDPPYLPETRKSKKLYAHEMTVAEHQEFLDVAKACVGKVMISGYANPLYDETLKDWNRHDFNLANHLAGGKSKRRMVECVYCNY